MNIIVTGTPGVGKTSIAEKLALTLNLQYVNLHEEIVKTGLVKYNDEFGSYEIINVNEVIEILNSKIIDNCVIETIVFNVLKLERINWIVVLRLHPKELLRRLVERGWKKIKIYNNVFSEILDVVLQEVLKTFSKDKVIEIDTTGKSTDEVVSEIIKYISEGKSRFGVVDWLSICDVEFLMMLEKFRNQSF